jgi:iron(III) transport system ATP-binding protein
MIGSTGESFRFELRDLKRMSGQLWKLDNVSLGDHSNSDGSGSRLADISLTLRAGSTAVIGFSGSGKTSLLNLLTRFERPTSGQIKFTAPADHPLPLFWVPQDCGLWPHLSAIDHLRTVSPTDQTGKQLLADFDLDHRSAAKPGQLSRGEQARLSVARCLAANPAVMVMDEPLAHVDPARIDRYLQVIRDQCRRNNSSIVYATHSPEWVLSDADTVICLRNGRVDYSGAVDQLYYQAPTSALASFLGATNWFTPQDASRWLPDYELDSACVRPECLRVVPRDGGQFIVTETRFLGSFAEAVVSDPETELTRRLRHRPGRDELNPGQRVAIEIISQEFSLVGE